ncbi:uncharacterized protein LOC134772232 [Penaeus indicus]|uniref:uncharacterized protein LOC134772232 n=1 Tax=Penaeus indicus TaxID=29960 RepID=UPI00300D4A3D
MCLPPTTQGITEALKRMNTGKAPGPDNIPLELLTHGGREAEEQLKTLFLHIWDTGIVPEDFRITNIITIFKKGDRTLCGNYHGIPFLSIAGKAFAQILLNRLIRVAEEVLPESQCGFRPSRGTVDMVLCARQHQEKSREQQQPLTFIFWDLQKAFDTVSRQAMWDTLTQYRCPDHFITLDGMTGRVSPRYPVGCIPYHWRPQVDIEKRIKSAHAAYGYLARRVFNNHDLSIKTKVMVFRAVVLSTLLYACETWTTYRRDLKKLESFQQAKLRRLLRIPWEQRVTNNEVLSRATLPSIETTILRHRLRWAGHVARMDNIWLPKIILYGELEEGRRPCGAPKRRFKDQLKRSLDQMDINPSTWDLIAQDRLQWRQTV